MAAAPDPIVLNVTPMIDGEALAQRIREAVADVLEQAARDLRGLDKADPMAEPTEPGYYIDREGDGWRLDRDGVWAISTDGPDGWIEWGGNPVAYAPLTRVGDL